VASAAPATVHQHQQAAPCIQIGVIGIARLREGCRGRKSKRKSVGDAKRDDAPFHDCTSRGHLHDKFIAPPQAIGAPYPVDVSRVFIPPALPKLRAALPIGEN
jgi:hypothetical protein